MGDNLLDVTTRSLASSINLRQLRHGVAASNVANAETPGYHAKKLDFEEALSRAITLEGMGGLDATDNDHFAVGQGPISGVKADVYENPEGNITNDGNTVDLEKEMAVLTENRILYKAALELIKKKMAALRYVATEGNR